MLLAVIIVSIAYAAGSINFAILLFRLLGKDDPRSKFSGNPGTTNVYRQAGYFWAAVILLLDMGRSMLVAGIAVYLLSAAQVPWAGLGLVIGTRYPCFHYFKGGKGVANYLGFTLILNLAAALISMAAWVLVYAVSRQSFIGSFAMIAVLSLGTIIGFSHGPAAVLGSLLTAGFIVFNHRQNIREFRASRHPA